MNRRIAILSVLALGGCAAQGYGTTKARATEAAVPKPAAVFVTDFAASPDAVHLDTGPGGKALPLAAGESPAAAKSAAVRATQAALATELDKQLAALGLKARTLGQGETPQAGSVVVRGVIHAVNEGRRATRTTMGFGGIPDSVDAEAQLFHIAANGRATFLQSFTASGAGAATASPPATSRADALTADQQNARKVADLLAEKIATYAARQGWIEAAPAT